LLTDFLFYDSSFFWLLSLLLSSIVWAIVVPLKEYLIFGVTCSVIFQEFFRYLFYRILRYVLFTLLCVSFNLMSLNCRKAEVGLQKVSDVGAGTGAKVYNDRVILSFGMVLPLL